VKSQKKNIVLIGFRCTGKTSVGKKISERLKMPFYDTDDLIIKDAGISISEIVAEKGWPYFRQREREIIARLSELQDCVIATGGGAILDKANVLCLETNGVFVWLKADMGTIAARMKASDIQGLRPSLTGSDPAEEVGDVLRQRLPDYEKLSDFSVDTAAVEVIAVAGTICDWFRKLG
jgi:shikimate kinase